MGFFDSFRNSSKTPLIIAIHVGLDEPGIIQDVEVARSEGADGIIFIRDYKTLATDDDVLASYKETRAKYPLWWIGLNLLDHTADETLMIVIEKYPKVSAIWFDQSNITEHQFGNSYLGRLYRTRERFNYGNLPLLPSVAFKYQRPVKDFALVTKLAGEYADAIVTSGEATGVAADFDKVKIMCEATDKPLGLASGVSVENVGRYLELGVRFFIINTSISDPKTGRLDPAKVAALRSKIPRS